MSDLRFLLLKLRTLEEAHSYSETIAMNEDTPSIAVARNKEVLHLKKNLLSLTKGCRKIQREPENALCRFLFSSKLPVLEHTQVIKDPLLPSTVSYDKSMMHELQRSQPLWKIVTLLLQE